MFHADKPWAPLTHVLKESRPYSRVDFQDGAMDPTLPNDRVQRTDPRFRAIRNRKRHCAKISSPLHDNVTPALANNVKAVLFEDAAGVSYPRIITSTPGSR